jgi:O-antigen ligase
MGGERYLVTACFVLLFPVFSVTATYDQNTQSVTQLTADRLVSLLWFATVLGCCLIGLYRLGVRGILESFRSLEISSLLLVLYLAGSALSILVNTPVSIKAWYRFSELAAAIGLVVILLRLVNGNVRVLAEAVLGVLSFLPLVFMTLFGFVSLYNPEILFMEAMYKRIQFGGYVYHPNHLALMLCLSQVGIVYKLVEGQWSKTFFFLYSLPLHIAVIMTDSRTGLALLAMVDVFSIIYLYLYRKGQSSGAFVFLGSLVLILCGIVYLGGMRFLLNYQSGGVGIAPFANVSTVNSRVYVWEIAIHSIRENPVMGRGYAIGGGEHMLASYDVDNDFKPPHCHNGYLEVVYAQGFLGGAAMIILLVWIVTKGLTRFLTLARNDLLQNTMLLLVGVLLLFALLYDAFGWRYRACSGAFFLCASIFLSQKLSSTGNGKTITEPS